MNTCFDRFKNIYEFERDCDYNGYWAIVKNKEGKIIGEFFIAQEQVFEWAHRFACNQEEDRQRRIAMKGMTSQEVLAWHKKRHEIEQKKDGGCPWLNVNTLSTCRDEDRMGYEIHRNDMPMMHFVSDAGIHAIIRDAKKERPWLINLIQAWVDEREVDKATL